MSTPPPPTMREYADAAVVDAVKRLKAAALAYAVANAAGFEVAGAAAGEHLELASAAHGAALSLQRLADACTRAAEPAIMIANVIPGFKDTNGEAG